MHPEGPWREKREEDIRFIKKEKGRGPKKARERKKKQGSREDRAKRVLPKPGGGESLSKGGFIFCKNGSGPLVPAKYKKA